VKCLLYSSCLQNMYGTTHTSKFNIKGNFDPKAPKWAFPLVLNFNLVDRASRDLHSQSKLAGDGLPDQ
jgi:hypothetical protein